MAGASMGGSFSQSSQQQSQTGTIKTTQDVTSKKGTEQGANILSDLLANLFADTQTTNFGIQYSKQAAVADAQAAGRAASSRIMQEAVPAILQGDIATGAYDSTTGKLLTQRAVNEAAAAEAGVIQQSILNYAGLVQQERQQKMSNILSALGLDQSMLSNVRGTTEEERNLKTNTNTTSFGAQLGYGAGG